MKKNSDDSMNNVDNSFDLFLKSQLQQSHNYLPDDNFAANVMVALSVQIPTQKKLSRRKELLIVVVPCLLIALLVLSQFPLVALAIKSWVWLSLINITGWVQLSLVMFVLGLLGAVAWFMRVSRLL